MPFWPITLIKGSMSYSVIHIISYFYLSMHPCVTIKKFLGWVFRIRSALSEMLKTKTFRVATF